MFNLKTDVLNYFQRIIIIELWITFGTFEKSDATPVANEFIVRN